MHFASYLRAKAYFVGTQHRRMKRNRLGLLKVCEVSFSHRPDAALGHPDQPRPGDRVVRVCKAREISHRVFNLCALIELRAAQYAVRNSAAYQQFFKGTRLRVRTIEHGNVTVGKPCSVQIFYFFGNKPGLVMLRISGEADDLGAVTFISPQVLFLPIKVL